MPLPPRYTKELMANALAPDCDDDCPRTCPRCGDTCPSCHAKEGRHEPECIPFDFDHDARAYLELERRHGEER